MENVNKSYLNGIGGWLILPAIGIVASIPTMAFTIISSFNDIVFSEILSELSSPDSPYYLPGFFTIYLIEIIGNIIFLLSYCYLAYLFFTKNYKTPKFVIILHIAYLTFLVVDTVLAGWVIDESMFDPETAREIGRSIIACVIWIPYFLVSVRVKNTFVNGKPNYDTISDKSGIVS